MFATYVKEHVLGAVVLIVVAVYAVVVLVLERAVILVDGFYVEVF